MGQKRRPKKKSDGKPHTVDADDNDAIIGFLKNRVAVLENELLSTRKDLQVVTEHKWAEQELKESEARFKTLVESSPAAISLFQDDNVVYVNDDASAITGYSREERLKMKFWDIVHPDDQELVKKRIQARVGGEPGNPRNEYRVVRKDGEVRWVISSAARLDYHGKPATIVTTIDITERKQAEEALRESEETYRFLVENSKDITWKIDLRGRWTFISGNAEKVTGYRADESVGKPIQDFLAPESYELVNEKLRRRLLGEEIPPYEVLIRNRDGHYTPFELLTAPIIDDDGKIVGVQGVGRDISYRKEAEEALCNSEAKFRTLFENAGAAIYIIDVETGAIVDCNSNAELLVGRTRDELMEMVVTQLHPPDDVEKHRRNYVGRARQGHVINNEGEALHRDGRRIPVIINAAPIVIGGRKVMMGVFLDITERKRAEEELQDAKARAELYLDLMGHDINNMHQIALGYLELALNLPLDARQDEVFEKPIEVLQRSARLIKNVRKLQRIRDGVFQTHDVDVCKILIDVQREFGAVPGKTITLNLNGHDHCYVRANELLHDIFANLVSNAIKHTSNPAEIIIDIDRVIDDDKPCYRVIVEDDGPGIPDDSKGRIFHRMLKGTTDAKGMGLGLYLVKSLVESNNGKVWVGDRVHGDHTKGARFVVMLPAAGQ